MIVLINPNLIVQRNDPFTTGIVYMPIGLAYVAASLKASQIAVEVIDAFAEKPKQARHEGKFLVLGLSYDEILARISAHAKAVYVYANHLTNHLSVRGIIGTVRRARPGLPIVVLENTQAVTAYSLRDVGEELFDAGADYYLSGEGERTAIRLAQALLMEGKTEALRSIEGLTSRDFHNEPGAPISDLDTLPFPAWDLFPIEKYWNLRFAHGPQSTMRYLPLLTSRGCPHNCRFCVAPRTSYQRWRQRSGVGIVDEMEFYAQTFNVREFHVEDLNPTVSEGRVVDLCNEILARRLDIIWKIAAGTRIETIRAENTIELMAKAGCTYISVSPESGSSRVLAAMNKPFDLQNVVRMVGRMHQAGIYSQACFVLGFPGEIEEDLKKTRLLVKDLTRKGVDEIALFIITPVPGSQLYEIFKGYNSLSELNFSPTWRADYAQLNRFRIRLYVDFLFWKLRFHPLKILRQPFKFLRRRFDTKMEMAPYRAIVLKWLDKTAANV